MDVVVIGAGAAGLVAGAEAARRSANVVMLEKSGKTGVKILMSGGTRCNITHDTDPQGIIRGFGRNGRFLQPSVGAFGPSEVVSMFQSLGVRTKVEETGKVFPQSDRAVEVRDALERMAREAGVDIRLRCPALAIRRDGSRWCVSTPAGVLLADRLIVTSGGCSWPRCGTTGDAYDWLEQLGHTLVRPRPALVPLVGGTEWMRALSGITLSDTLASVLSARTKGKKKPLIQRRSSLLFTHFGFSGPAAMDVSGTLTAASSLADVRLVLDLLPDVDMETLQSTFGDRSAGAGRRTVRSVLGQWLPNRLAQAFVEQTSSDVTLAELPRRSLQRLVEQLKRLEIPVTGTQGFGKAEVTAGGVNLAEVDPRTMASRIADDLYIAGEVLDVDGWIGGYNFQAAFSTGRAAGIAAAS